MKLDEKEVYGIAVKFMGVFFILAKQHTSFLNVLLGFIYSAKTISKAMERLNILSNEELNSISEELSKAVDSAFEENMKVVEALKANVEALEEKSE